MKKAKKPQPSNPSPGDMVLDNGKLYEPNGLPTSRECLDCGVGHDCYCATPRLTKT